MMRRPETRYLQTEDGFNVGYQVFGDGPVDLAVNNGYISNVDAAWDHPVYDEFYRSLARRARVITFDRRGTGVSDRPCSPDEMALEKGADDLRAVLDAVGSERAVIWGAESGAAVALLFAASRPERTMGLALYFPLVAYWKTPDFPWGETEASDQEWWERVARSWGTEAFWRWNFDGLDEPSRAGELAAWARFSRLCVSPAGALAATRAERELDVRSVLPSVHVPTIVFDHPGSTDTQWGAAWISARIPASRHCELTGSIHFPIAGGQHFWTELDRFLASIREEQASLDRVLATVLFTDIVDSTATAAVMGDTRWRALIAQHDELAKSMVARFRGRYVRGTGDGMLATFDGPARAVRCAEAFVEAARALGIEVRAGTHAGEITFGGNDIAGIGVHAAARVAALAGPGEVWASSTVKDLTAGSGLAFEDRGEHELKGVPDRWHLYRVAGG